MNISINSGPLLDIGTFFSFLPKIRVYGLFLLIGFLLANFVALFDRRRKLFFDSALQFLDQSAFSVLFALVGGRLLYIFSNYDQVEGIFDGLNPSTPGMSQMGAVFFGAMGLVLWAQINGKNFLAMFNFTLTYVPLAEAFGRLGCLLAGCCYGLPVDANSNLGRLLSLVPTVTYSSPDSLAPANLVFLASPLLTAFVAFGLFLFLFWVKERKTLNDKIVWFYLIIQGLGRFFLDWTRGSRLIFVSIFSIDQVLAFIIGTIGLVGLFFSFYWSRDQLR